MSQATSTTPYTELRVGKGPSRTVPFARLTAVEIRKLIDTRTSIALLVLVALGGVGGMAARAFFTAPNLQDVFISSALLLGILLPVLGVIAVTSEWSKRTALTTFALEPRRWRVMVAKLIAGAVVALTISGLMLAVAYPMTTAAASIQGKQATFDLDPAVVAGWTGTNVLFILSGLAIGAMLLNAAASIVVYFVVSFSLSLVALAGSTWATLARWVDLGSTTMPLASGGMTVASAGPLLASIGIWIVLPFVIGLVRISRSELR